MSQVRERFLQVFRDVFDDPELAIEDSMNASDFEDWDSLQHINLIIATEQGLGVRFTTSEISRLKQPDQNIGTFVALLERKLQKADPSDA